MVGIGAGFIPSSHAPSQTISRSHSSCQKANDITTCINIHTHRYETGEQSHGAAKLTCAGELISKARAGLTFLQSLQNTEALPRKPKTSPQSRHWERPLPITFRCIVSSRSTRRLQHRIESERMSLLFLTRRLHRHSCCWQLSICAVPSPLPLANSQSLVNLPLTEHLGCTGHWEDCSKQARYRTQS